MSTYTRMHYRMMDRWKNYRNLCDVMTAVYAPTGELIVNDRLRVGPECVRFAQRMTDHWVTVEENGEERRVLVKGAAQPWEKVLVVGQTGGYEYWVVDRIG